MTVNFFLSDNNLPQFLQDTNYLAGTHCTVLDPERTMESISPWENLFFKLNSSFFKKLNSVFPSANPKVPQADDSRHYLQQFLLLTDWDQNTS